MKKTFIFLLIIFCAVFANAQSKPNPLKAAPPVSKTIEVSKEGTVTSFETNLISGSLTLTKGYFKNVEGTAVGPVYSLIKRNDPSFNKTKPIVIGLSRKSFDSVFTYVSRETADKRIILDRYINDNKLSLNEEKGWITLIRYYNSL
ncbi:MAG: hypothetical protein ABI581_07190 [Sediminibacterium sp.]